MTRPPAPTAPADPDVRREERRFRLLAESLPQLVWTAGPDGARDYVNRRWADYTGRPVADAHGFGWLDAVHPDDRAGHRATLARAVAAGAPMEAEYRLRRHDGAYRWHLGRAEPLTDDAGQPVRWFGTATDIDDRKRAEADRLREHAAAARRETEERFRLLAEAGPQLVWACHPDGHCEYLNRRWLDYTGATEGDHLGAGWLDAIHPDDRGRTAALWREFLAGRAEYDLEYRLRRHDGAYRWFRTRGLGVRDAAGTVARVVGSCTDVDDAKRAEQELREGRERLDAALTASGTGTFRWDIRTDGLDWDAELDRRFGLPPGETARSLDQFLALVHPDDRAGVVDRCRRCWEDGADFRMEFRVVWPDGSVRWLDDRGKTYRDPAGRPAYMTGACVDVTDRKRAEEALRASEARSRRLAEANVVGVVEWAAGGVLTNANDEFLRIVGRTRDDLPAGRLTAEALTPPEQLPDSRRAMARLRQTGVCPPYEKEYLRPDGTRVPVLVGGASFAEGGGDAGISLVMDLSDRKRAEDALKEADRRKDEFLAMLAHELRNPLGPVRNAAQILRLAGGDDPVLVRARDMIERQVAHMARLVDDLLDVSRIARGKVRLRPERCDLAELIRQTAEDYRPTLDARGLALDLRLPPGPVWADADPTRLAQAVSNLLHNAGKFTDVGGRVSVELETRPGEAAIRIRDTGIGMEPDVLAQVFDPFTQADRSLDRSRGGLGLGLALVKGLVALHGGSVAAASGGLGLGSEFTVRIPLPGGTREHPAGGLALPPSPAVSAHLPTVLIVEDNRDAAESMRLLLDLTGYPVRVAHSGPDGLAAARSARADVVLCDIGLPGGMDGYELARTLRSDPAACPGLLVALTGYGQDEDHRRARAAGFDLHLVKPVEYAVLRDVLERAGRAR